MMDFPNDGNQDALAMETSDGRRRFFAGDSLQQALVQAANYFNLDPEYVEYKSLEKRHGFLKVRRKFVIEVDPDHPRREKPQAIPAASRPTPPAPAGALSAPAPAPAEGPSERGGRPAPKRNQRSGERGGRGERRGGPSQQAGRGGRSRESGEDRSIYRMAERQPPVREGLGLVRLSETPRSLAERYPLAEGAVAEAAKKGAEILLRVAGLDLAATIYQGEERLEVDLTGPDVDWCFADDGEFVMAAEHLLPRLIRSLSGETTAVRVDCDNFHEIREERLRALAQKAAEEARRLGRSQVLEPMNPADRRIVHTTLTDDPGVTTESAGDGYFKRITIRLV